MLWAETGIGSHVCNYMLTVAAVEKKWISFGPARRYSGTWLSEAVFLGVTSQH